LAERKIELYYSVDADDAFMFYAIREKKIDLKGYYFLHHRKDTETLNRLAMEKRGDVMAVSVFNYANIYRDYLLLPHGGSVGQNYGPVIISKTPFPLSELPRKKLAIPGENTTAANVVRMLSPGQPTAVIPIDPFSAIFEALESGEVEAGLVIHEGRMCYDKMGYRKIIDIGEWWYKETGDPLPLGANVISRKLGKDTIDEVNAILYESIRWALEHKEELIPFLQSLKSPREKELGLAEPETISAYLDLYANNDTLLYGERERNSLVNFFRLAKGRGIIAHHVPVEFAELQK
jgi:1,4-dihydroxy-6-naphthoate synthase